MTNVSTIEETSSPPKLWIAGLVGTTVVATTLALTAPFVMLRSPLLPYMGTPRHKIQQALLYCRQTHNCQRFVDLGSGDGEAVYQAVQVGFQHAVGVELNGTLYLLSQIRRRFFWTRDQQKCSQFYYRDMLDYSVQNCDAILIFGVQPLMRPLSHKFQRECSYHALILSYRFPLPVSGRNDEVSAKLVYNQDEMRIYQVAQGQ